MPQPLRPQALTGNQYSTKGTIPKGNRYNEGKPRWWTLVDFEALEPMLRVLEFGATKYSDNQWKLGLEMDAIMDSLLRHLVAIQKGEELDPESQLPHIGHALCNLYFYSHFYQKAKIKDHQKSEILPPY
jgi:hypothetical protein